MQELSAGFCDALLSLELRPDAEENDCAPCAAIESRWSEPTLQVVDIQRFRRRMQLPTDEAAACFYLAASDGHTLVWLLILPHTRLETSIVRYELDVGCCVTLHRYTICTAANSKGVVVPLRMTFTSHTCSLLGRPRCDPELFSLSQASLLRMQENKQRRKKQQQQQQHQAASRRRGRAKSDDAEHTDVLDELSSNDTKLGQDKPGETYHANNPLGSSSVATSEVVLRDLRDRPAVLLRDWVIAVRIVWKGKERRVMGGGGRWGNRTGARVVTRCIVVDRHGEAIECSFCCTARSALTERVMLHHVLLLGRGSVEWGKVHREDGQQLQLHHIGEGGGRNQSTHATAATPPSRSILDSSCRKQNFEDGNAGDEMMTVAELRFDDNALMEAGCGVVDDAEMLPWLPRRLSGALGSRVRPLRIVLAESVAGDVVSVLARVRAMGLEGYVETKHGRVMRQTVLLEDVLEPAATAWLTLWGDEALSERVGMGVGDGNNPTPRSLLNVLVCADGCVVTEFRQTRALSTRASTVILMVDESMADETARMDCGTDGVGAVMDLSCWSVPYRSAKSLARPGSAAQTCRVLESTTGTDPANGYSNSHTIRATGTRGAESISGTCEGNAGACAETDTGTTTCNINARMYHPTHSGGVHSVSLLLSAATPAIPVLLRIQDVALPFLTRQCAYCRRMMPEPVDDEDQVNDAKTNEQIASLSNDAGTAKPPSACAEEVCRECGQSGSCRPAFSLRLVLSDGVDCAEVVGYADVGETLFAMTETEFVTRAGGWQNLAYQRRAVSALLGSVILAWLVQTSQRTGYTMIRCAHPDLAVCAQALVAVMDRAC